LAENSISITFEATADTAKAESQMASMGASIDGTMQRTAKSANAAAAEMDKTLAQFLKQTGATAKETAIVYAQLGQAGEKAAEEISAAFRTKPVDAMTALKKSLREFGDVALAAGRDLAVIGGGVIALGAGLLKLAQHAAEAGAKIYDAHEKTGLAAASLSGLNAISRVTGENFDSLTMALGRAGRNLTLAINEPGALTGKVLAGIMGGAENLKRLGLEPMDQALQQVLARIFALNNVGERNLALQALLGRGWMENVETLKLLATQGYEPAIAKAKELGIFFDEKSARDAKQFTLALNSMKAELSGMALTLGKEVMPYAEEFLAWLHTLKTNLEVDALRAEALAAALAAPLTGGASLIATHILLAKASKLEADATQEQTNWLVKVDAAMRAAAASAKGLAGSMGAAGGAGGQDPKAVKEYTDALGSQLEKTQAVVAAMLGSEIPARRQIEAEYQKEILAAKNLFAKDQELFEQKKISLMELGKRQAEYKDLVILYGEQRDRKLEELDAKDAARHKREIDRLIQAHQQRLEKEQEGFARLQQIEASKTLELAKDEHARILIREQRELFDLEALKQSLLRLATTEKQKTAIIAQAERDRQLITAAASKAIADSIDKTGVHQALQQQRLDWQMLSQGTRTALSEMTGALAGWGGVATRIFDQMANQIVRQVELDQEQAIEHQASQVSMARSTLTAMKQTAFYKVYWHTAKAIGELASMDFRAAALDFAAAGLYAIVAGAQVAAMVGAIGGGGGGRAASGVKAGGIQPAAAVTQPQAAGPTVNVYVDGVISPDNLDQVLQQINDRVQDGYVHLVSTTTLAPPVTRS